MESLCGGLSVGALAPAAEPDGGNEWIIVQGIMEFIFKLWDLPFGRFGWYPLSLSVPRIALFKIG